MFLFCFQIKDIDTHAYVDLWHLHNGDRNQQNKPVTLNTFLYWLTNLLIATTFLYWQVMFRCKADYEGAIVAVYPPRITQLLTV